MERKEEKIRNDGQAGPASMCISISSINADTQDTNSTGLFPRTTTRIENEIVSSSNNLRNITTKRKSRHIIREPIITSSSIERSSRKKAHLCDGKTLLISENLSGKAKYSSSPTNMEDDLDDDDDDDNFGRPSIVATTSPEERYSRTFFNWRVVLNENGHLLIKGTLESGKIARTKPILKRLTATSVESIFKQIYHLKGNIVDNRNELPEYVRGKFFDGFPDDWENIVGVWRLFISRGSNSNFHWPSQITEDDDDDDDDEDEDDDDDNDANRKMSDVTFERTRKYGTELNELGVVSTIQIPNVSNFRIPFNDSRGNNWKEWTLKTKTGNNVDVPEIHVPGSTNLLLPSVTKKMHNYNDLDKENRYIRNKNVSIGRLPLLPKEDTASNIKEDTINTIVNNLLHKDCPKEYIIKIIQMFDSSENVYHYRQVDELINNSEGSRITTERCDESNTEDAYKTSDVISKGTNTNAYVEPEKVNDTLSRKSHKKDSEEFENETYLGKSKIISERILLPYEKMSVKWHEHEDGRERTNHKPVNNGRVIKVERKMKKAESMYRCNSSDNVIENDMENDDPARVSVTLRKGKRKRDNNAINQVALASDRIKGDSLKNNRNWENSNKEDDIESSEFGREERSNATEIAEHSVKKSRRVTNTFVNVPRRTSSEIGINGTDNKTTFMSSKERQKEILEPLAIGKSFLNLDANPNEDTTTRTTYERSQFIRVLSETKERNKNMPTLRPDIIMVDDRCCSINEDKNDSEGHRRITRGSDIRIECEISSEKNAKCAAKKANTSSLMLNPTSWIGTCRSMNASNDEFLSPKKPRPLSDWMPRVVFDSKSVCELSLVFEGNLLNDAGHVVNRKFTTEHIRKRLSATLIEDTNRQVYRLVGDLHDSKHVVPKELLRYCREGCPFDINAFCKTWESHRKANARETLLTKQGNKAIDISNVPTSSRGRRIFPPLSYWTGERVAFRDNEIVYKTGSSPNYSTIDRSAENKSNKSNFQEGNKVKENSANTKATTRTNTNYKETYVKSKDTNISGEKMQQQQQQQQQQAEENACDRSNDDPDRSEISRRKGACDASKDENTMLLLPTGVLERRAADDIRSGSRCDVKLTDPQKTDRNNDAAAISQSDERRKRYRTGQQSPIKKTNIMYTYYKSIPYADDVLSDDQISQLWV